MSIIEDFFNGNIYPYEALQDSKKYHIASAVLHKQIERIEKGSFDSETIGDKLMEQFSVMQYESSLSAFIIGFSLGLQFSSESYNIGKR